MNKTTSLKSKIMRSAFLYETKELSIHAFEKITLFFFLFFLFLIFGGIIVDIYFESELNDLIGNVINSSEYTLTQIERLYLIVSSEVPLWIVGVFVLTLCIGCILVLSIVKNWVIVSKKIRLITKYWLKI